jgi:hypothetical protein
MNESLRPDEAAQALREIGQRHEQIVELTVIPAWYWWSIAVLMVAFAAVADTRQPVATGIGVAIFVIAVLGLTARIVLRALRSAKPRDNLIGVKGGLAIPCFVLLTLAVSLPTAFILDASGVAHPAVIGVSLGALMMGFGGPVLMRYLRRVMIENQTGGSR